MSAADAELHRLQFVSQVPKGARFRIKTADGHTASLPRFPVADIKKCFIHIPPFPTDQYSGRIRVQPLSVIFPHMPSGPESALQTPNPI